MSELGKSKPFRFIFQNFNKYDEIDIIDGMICRNLLMYNNLYDCDMIVIGNGSFDKRTGAVGDNIKQLVSGRIPNNFTANTYFPNSILVTVCKGLTTIDADNNKGWVGDLFYFPLETNKFSNSKVGPSFVTVDPQPTTGMPDGITDILEVIIADNGLVIGLYNTALDSLGTITQEALDFCIDYMETSFTNQNWILLVNSNPANMVVNLKKYQFKQFGATYVSANVKPLRGFLVTKSLNVNIYGLPTIGNYYNDSGQSFQPLLFEIPNYIVSSNLQPGNPTNFNGF